MWTDDEAIVVWRDSGHVFAADLRTGGTIRIWTARDLGGSGAVEPAISESFDLSRGDGLAFSIICRIWSGLALCRLRGISAQLFIARSRNGADPRMPNSRNS